MRRLNIDLKQGGSATIIHSKAGSEIAVHFHEGEAEAHYVLDGESVDAGQEPI